MKSSSSITAPMPPTASAICLECRRNVSQIPNVSTHINVAYSSLWVLTNVNFIFTPLDGIQCIYDLNIIVVYIHRAHVRVSANPRILLPKMDFYSILGDENPGLGNNFRKLVDIFEKFGVNFRKYRDLFSFMASYMAGTCMCEAISD